MSKRCINFGISCCNYKNIAGNVHLLVVLSWYLYKLSIKIIGVIEHNIYLIMGLKGYCKIKIFKTYHTLVKIFEIVEKYDFIIVSLLHIHLFGLSGHCL